MKKTNKFLSLLLIVFFALTLAACGEKINSSVPEDTTPSLEITVADVFSLSQNEDAVKKVDFTANIKNIEGKISWYVNNVVRDCTEKVFSFTPNLAGSYRVYCKVTRADKTNIRSKTLEIVVSGGTTAEIKVSVNNADTLVQYENAYKKAIFTARVTGNYDGAVTKLNWYVNDVKQKGSEGLTTFEYTPTAIGDYIVYAEVDGRFRSNFYKIGVSIGKLTIATKSALEQKAGAAKEVVMTAETAGVAVGGNIDWYVNGELVEDENNVLRFTPSAVGAYKVVAKYNDIESEARYVILGTPVDSESKLLTALNTSDAIYLERDLLVDSERINIVRKVAIAGCGHTITSAVGSSILMNVMADNVIIYDLNLSDAGKYTLQFYKSKYCYIEKITLNNAGYSGLHVNRSQVTAKDIFVTNSFYAGAELSHDDYDKETLEGGTSNDWYHIPSTLTVLGSFVYTDGDLPAPIYTFYNAEACRVISDDFNEFAISAMVGSNEKILRRWCNDGCNIGWTIKAPSKTDYISGDKLDLDGIGLRVAYCGETMVFDISYVFMAIDYNFTARMEFVGDSGQVVDTFYIDSYDSDTQELIYKDKDGTVLDGRLTDLTLVQVRIYVADLYVGSYSITVSPTEG
jgi:hypothetical protein